MSSILPLSSWALDAAEASQFAELALAGMDREYPNKPGEILTSDKDLKSPRAMHPAFFGHFDWHSSVHAHWLLVRLLRLYPDIENAQDIVAALDRHLTPENLRGEADYFQAEFNRSFERMYGWAWALRLSAELRAWPENPRAQRWLAALQPLELILVERTKEFLPKLTYPIRTGVHQDTAFSLAQILDYARIAGERDLEQLIIERSRNYFLNDRDYPIDYEPSGEDFFSSGLNVADLMRRVLDAQSFSTWLNAYMPSLRKGALNGWSTPSEVSDITDLRIVHLVGLNLSRGWTMQGIASALPEQDPRRTILLAAAKVHTDAGLSFVFSGHYGGDHWLATFAVYTLTHCGI